MASDTLVPLLTRSAIGSFSYTQRAALAERLAAHRHLARDTGTTLTQLLPRRGGAASPSTIPPLATQPSLAVLPAVSAPLAMALPPAEESQAA